MTAGAPLGLLHRPLHLLALSPYLPLSASHGDMATQEPQRLSYFLSGATVPSQPRLSDHQHKRPCSARGCRVPPDGCTNGPLCHALAAPLPLPLLMRVPGASLGHSTHQKQLHVDRSRLILSEEWASRWQGGNTAAARHTCAPHRHQQLTLPAPTTPNVCS